MTRSTILQSPQLGEYVDFTKNQRIAMVFKSLFMATDAEIQTNILLSDRQTLARTIAVHVRK